MGFIRVKGMIKVIIAANMAVSFRNLINEVFVCCCLMNLDYLNCPCCNGAITLLRDISSYLVCHGTPSEAQQRLVPSPQTSAGHASLHRGEESCRQRGLVIVSWSDEKSEQKNLWGLHQRRIQAMLRMC